MGSEFENATHDSEYSHYNQMMIKNMVTDTYNGVQRNFTKVNTKYKKQMRSVQADSEYQNVECNTEGAQVIDAFSFVDGQSEEGKGPF